MTQEQGKYRGSKAFLLVYSELITAARRRDTITYMEVASHLGISQPGHHMAREVGIVLGEISEDEVKHGRPMLSAIAVSTTGKPGDGFYQLANDMGLLTEDTPEARQSFLQAQWQAVYETWA